MRRLIICSLLCLLFMVFLLTMPVIGKYRKGSYYDRIPDIEKEHAGIMYTTEMSRVINGSDAEVIDPRYTPDFRIQEQQIVRWYPYFMKEEERPYRVSPAYKQLGYWYGRDSPKMLGCACTTVFKRTHLLAGCTVLTTKHALTTATSTELLLRSRRQLNRLTNVMGVWYDINANDFNSSYYNTPVRIHYHPRYVRPKAVNRSHPIPVMFDLSVWTMMYNFYVTRFIGSDAYICSRGGSGRLSYGSSYPQPGELALIAGFQFMRSYGRKPMPWFKYAIRTRKHIQPCPKVEWGWFSCIIGNWARLGLDSGAALFSSLEGSYWRFDGLIGLNAVSMRLRSLDMIHYFTALNTHPVLDFLYAAYMGTMPYEYLDKRFEDTKMRSPVTKKFRIVPEYDTGYEHYYKKDLPSYK